MKQVESIIFHIDVNSAFLSWEAVYRLQHGEGDVDLRTIPSAIGGDKESRHGIILAKSESAKRFGVVTAEPVGNALKKCPNLIIVPPRFDFYQKCSTAFLSILREYSPDVEQYSIDEAFVDMTHCESLIGSPEDVAHAIKNRIHRELGFTVNIGIAHNKLLAKMASDFKKPNLVHTLYEWEIASKMWPLPVEDLFFVGKATAKKLHNLGIRTIGELSKTDVSILTSHLGKHGALIHQFANGIDTSSVMTKSSSRKGYGNSTTISYDVTDSKEAKKILLSLCETICRRLRRDSVSIYVVSVTIKNCYLESTSHQKTLLSPTNVVRELYQSVCELFDELWDESPIRLLGVQTSRVTRCENQQLTLFSMESFNRDKKLEKSLDQIRDKFGDQSIMRASFIRQEDASDKTSLPDTTPSSEHQDQ